MRGYAPEPGQPPPIYPPGQFAAWNRRGEGDPDRPPQADGEGGPPTGIAPAGAPQAQSARGGRGEQYYAQDADPGNEPGYSVLATSDPAADVTSTQTWRAIGEGRSTGIWTAPPGLRAAIPGAAASADTASVPPTRRPGRHGPGSPPAAGDVTIDTGSNPRVSTGPNLRVSTGPQARVVTGPQPRVVTGTQSRVGTGPQPRVGTGPQPRISAAENPSAGADARTDNAAGTGRRGTGTNGPRRPHRGRPANVKLAVAAALLLVLAAAATLIYTVVHDSTKPKLTSQPPSKPSATASASVGPYGDIASRQTDPQPLTLAELFPSTFVQGGIETVTIAASSLSGDCAAAIDGATLQSAVGAAGCNQVARATYVETPAGIMATIGVFNLTTGDAAKTAAQAADANDFVSQLIASGGPAQTIGQGTGIEEALAKGHYLILVWAELTSRQSPNAQQSTGIEGFMTQLVQGTANRSLTTRMLTGAP